jgi:hypothetical protein
MLEMKNLSYDDRMLVNTQFPAELEKEAAAEAAMINDLYSYGYEKVASSTIDFIEKGAEEGETKEEEKKEETAEENKEDYKEKLNEEEKKEASVRGAFIARGFVDRLVKEGQDRYNDPYFFFYDMINEKVAQEIALCKEANEAKAMGRVAKFLQASKEKALAAAGKAKNLGGKAVGAVKSEAAKTREGFGKMMDKNLSKSDRAKAAIRPVGYTAGALGAAGYGAKKVLGKKEEKKGKK